LLRAGRTEGRRRSSAAASARSCRCRLFETTTLEKLVAEKVAEPNTFASGPRRGTGGDLFYATLAPRVLDQNSHSRSIFR
jgi:hypothetical protein